MRRWVLGSDGKPTANATNLDYAAEWTTAYTGTLEDTGPTASYHAATRDYYHTLMSLLAEKYPLLKNSIRLIPVGEVLFAIDAKIKDRKLPNLQELAGRKPEMLSGLKSGTGYSNGINVLYADNIHLNPFPHQVGTLGIFLSGSTIFTVLSGQNPVGLSGTKYGLDDQEDAALIKAVQETIWK